MTGCETMRCKYYDKGKNFCNYRGDTCIYNKIETDDDYDTLKAKAELFDELIKFATESRTYYNTGQFDPDVMGMLKSIIRQAKEL